MRVTTMSQMWSLLQAHTLAPSGEERPVNHLNEWGGFSRRLQMPVFTGWYDQTNFDKVGKTTTALVSDVNWSSAVGVNNQERWLKFAEERCGGIAAFFIIHAVDQTTEPRTVKFIDDDKVFVGKIIRNGTKTFIEGRPRPL